MKTPSKILTGISAHLLFALAACVQSNAQHRADPTTTVPARLKQLGCDASVTYKTNGNLVSCTVHCRDLDQRNRVYDDFRAAKTAALSATREPPTVCIVLPLDPEAFKSQQATLRTRQQDLQAAAAEEERRSNEQLRLAKKEQEAQEEAREAERLAPFKLLLEGEPGDPYAKVEYQRERERVQQAVQSGNVAYAQYAREILTLADEITSARLSGNRGVVESNGGVIKQRLKWLLDADVIK